MKKLLLVAALIFLIAPPARAQADTSSYGTKDNVGFTGEWTTPSSTNPESNRPTPTPSPGGNQTTLPKTGDDTLSDAFGLLSGVTILGLATILVKRQSH
ncbi:LPXTG cell wall anchor domain-containing protein [Lactococcus kimchii]|uniref:LPXTG cell wall anchor domain-containing protein n=1 Tax=Lactococcus sp. S-13 TaxID=2507158 RepID=UPI001680D53B|nr:LPXTG cell wall anchor domain-containing protein [Lactococcus sp. S-13]